MTDGERHLQIQADLPEGFKHSQRVGRRLSFVQGRLHADGRLVGQCSATFAVGEPIGDGEAARRR